MRGLLENEIISIPVGEIGERLSRYRVVTQQATDLMRQSLERCGQLAPVILCRLDASLELVDGFKRLVAARSIPTLEALDAKVIEGDETVAKIAIYVLNRAGGHLRDVEESWIVQSLVREDGLSQQEVAELLGRHKSWVSRRLALLERLCPEGQEDLRLGFLTPTAAREIYRLPRGNQSEVIDVVRRESFHTADTRLLVDAFLACPGRKEQEFVLSEPQQAISREGGVSREAYDPRLSAPGNRLQQRLCLLRDLLVKLEGWLRTRGRGELSPGDLTVIEPRVEKVCEAAMDFAEAGRDFLPEKTAR